MRKNEKVGLKNMSYTPFQSLKNNFHDQFQALIIQALVENFNTPILTPLMHTLWIFRCCQASL